MPTPTQHLLLCATHRTGSNLLEQYLKASLVAGRPREYYSRSLSKELAERLHLPNPEQDFLSYFRAITGRWTTENGVFAAKIMWRHLQVVQTRLAAVAQGAALVRATPWETLLALHPNPMVVHVTRRDKVRQAISMVRAKQTGVFSTVHLDYGRKEAGEDGAYDYHVLRYHVEKLTAEDAAWTDLFRQHQVPVQQIVFEEFIKDPRGQTIGLLQALKLPEPHTWHWPEVTIRKQSDATSAEWLDRYLQDDQHSEKLVDEQRERRHRARKALEKQAARAKRWKRWETHSLGRWLIQLECWATRHQPTVDPSEARGDGVEQTKRPRE